MPQPLRLGLLARTRDADFFERAVRRLQGCGERIVARLSSMAAMTSYKRPLLCCGHTVGAAVEAAMQHACGTIALHLVDSFAHYSL